MKQRYVFSAGFTALLAAAPGTAAAEEVAVAVADLQAKIARADSAAMAANMVLPERLANTQMTGASQPSNGSEAALDAPASHGIKIASASIPSDITPQPQTTQAPSKIVAPDTAHATSNLPQQNTARRTAPKPEPTAAIPAAAKPAPTPGCGPDGCKLKLTATQLLKMAEKLVAKRDFEKAAPLVEALGHAPEFKFEHLFLTGYIQVETGKLKEAESTFRTLLHANPGQTRIRLELARVLTLRGKEGAANYHYRLAQKDDSLPQDIRDAVTGIRSILRSQRNWTFNFNVGFAPDTNINSATSAESVNVNFGPITLPLTLSDEARKTSGIGQTASVNAGLRLRMSGKTAMLFDLNGRGVNYKGKVADDYQIGLAAGPEFRLGDTAAISVQALGQQRWYGGRRASTDFGARIGLKKILNEGQQLNFSIDGRRTNSGFSRGYTGWVVGGSATYERIIGKSFIASATLFGRRNALKSQEFSNKSVGLNLGIGGELPLGLNAGISGSVSRAVYDAPQLFYSDKKRKDWRLFGRAYVGLRSFRLMGFSPSVEVTYAKTDSNYTLNRSKRRRMHFKLARYF